MNPPELPGFHWDSERGRYFRVVRNGQVTVDQRSDARTRMQEYTRSELSRKRRIDSRSAENPVAQDILAGRHAGRHALLGRGSLANKKARASVGVSTDFRHIYTDNAILNAVHWDSCSKLVYTGSSNGEFSCVNPNGFRLDPGHEAAGAITSISSTEDYLSFTQSSDFGRGHVFVASKQAQTFVAGQLPHDVLISASVWWGNRLFLATSCGVQSFDPALKKLMVNAEFTKKAVTALDADGHKLAAGYRDGKVVVSDGTKTPLVINHQTCVTNIKLVGEKLLVSGLKDRMALYDLRKPSVPLFEYKSYHNWCCPSNGLALSPDRSMFAVGIDDGSLLIYDLGQPSPVYCPLRQHKEDEAIRGILWPHPAELYINDGKKLSRSSWGPDTERFPSTPATRLPLLVNMFWERTEDPEMDTKPYGEYLEL